MVVHEPARYVGLGWMAVGIVLYVVYRRADETSLLRRVTVSPQILRAEPPRERDYGSILVPLFGTELDDDIVQTAALLAAGEPTDEAAIDTATIEAVWIFVMPMSLPLDARLPEEQIKHARQALARAKAVGEEYGGVHVATATVRTRRAGYAIVERGAPARRGSDRARRRGTVADPRRRAPGGTGRAAGELRRGDHQVRRRARPTCRVIVTAPAAVAGGSPGREQPPAGPGEQRPASSNLRVRAMFPLISCSS